MEDPKYYFKYFINKNMHWNDRQRFAFACMYYSESMQSVCVFF